MIQNSKRPIFRPTGALGRTLAAMTVSTVALLSLPVGAQGVTGPSTGGTGTASGAAGITSSGTPKVAGNSANGTAGMVSRDDVKLMTDLVHGNIAEIETGKLALEKSQNEQVKKFAQHMIDDHTAALTEIQALAKAKGVPVPDGTDTKHKAMAAALKAMNGNSFDSQYMKRAGVEDHQQTLELLQKTQKTAKTPELKAMATKMIPIVQGHLKMAQQGVVVISDKK